MGGPPVSEYIEELITATWHILEQEGKSPTAQEVLEAAQNSLIYRGYEDRYRIPKIRKVQDILKDAREKRKALPVEKQHQDEPWCLGASVHYGIPIEANEDLLQLWKRCIVTGRKLTIREAKWAAHLRGIVPSNWLYYFSSLYANREYIHEITKGEHELLITTDLDKKIGFSHFGNSSDYSILEFWLSNATTFTDAIEQSLDKYLLDVILGPVDMAINKFHQTNKEQMSAMSSKDEVISQSIILNDKLYNLNKHMMASTFTQAGITVLIDLDIPLDFNYELNMQADMVFALYLRYFSKGPKWSELSIEERNVLVKRLYKYVKETNEQLQQFSTLTQLWTNETIQLALTLTYNTDFIRDIANEVGYTLKSPMETGLDHKSLLAIAQPVINNVLHIEDQLFHKKEEDNEGTTYKTK